MNLLLSQTQAEIENESLKSKGKAMPGDPCLWVIDEEDLRIRNGVDGTWPISVWRKRVRIITA